MSLFGGLTQSLFGGGGKASGEGVAAFNNLQTPDVHDMELQLDELVQQGILTPEQAQAAKVDGSAYQGITLDPSLKAAQLQSLAQLQDIGENGYSTGDRGDLQEIANQENATARGQRQAILQNAAARGAGGSGLELAAQLQNSQDSATRASQRGFDVAKQAQDRALQAITQSGQLAGNVRTQDMDEQSKIASAKDQIAQFNAQNQQQANLSNTNARNTAQSTNLTNQQNIANQNVGLRNQEQQYNKNLLQQDFENKYKKAGGTASALNNQAQQQNTGAGMDMNAIGSLAGAAASIYGGGSKSSGSGASTSYSFKDGGMVPGEPTPGDSKTIFAQPGEVVLKKENVPEFLKKAHTDEDGEFDAAGFLDSFTGGKYNYSGKGE